MPLVKRLRPERPSVETLDSLFKSCEDGDTVALSHLLSNITCDVSSLQNIDGMSLVELACSNLQSATLDFLLEHGTRIPVADQSKVLTTAVNTDSQHIIEAILAYTADISKKDLLPVFHQACSSGKAVAVQLLLPLVESNPAIASELLNACKRGDTGVAKAIAAHGVDVNAPVPLADGDDAEVTTLIAVAAAKGHQDVVAELINAGAVPDHSDMNQLRMITPNWENAHADADNAAEEHKKQLTKAVANGNTKKLAHLLERHIGIPDYDPFCDALLPIALKNGHDETAMLLMQHGAHVPTKYLWKVMRGNDNPSLKVDVRLLHDAIKGGCVISAKKLINCGVDVNKRITGRYYTNARLPDVLTLSSEPSMVKLLLDAKARVDPRGEYTAIRDFVPASVKMILEACPDVYCGPIIRAIKAPCSEDKVADKVEVMKLLLDHRTHDVTRFRMWESSLFVCALASDDPSSGQVAKLLIERHPKLYCQVHMSRTSSYTAVRMAAHAGNLEVFRVLVEDELVSRVRSEISDAVSDKILLEGLTPRSIFGIHTLASLVMGRGHPRQRREIMRLCCERGADFSVLNQSDQTVLMGAVQFGQASGLPDHASAILIGDIAEYMLARGQY